jgi:DNA-binding Lrp family transcriptional regulator
MRFTSRAPARLDAVDRKILALLSRDARSSASALARAARVSREVAAYRLKRLEEDRVITGYVPLLNTDSAPGEVYYVFFLLDERDAKRRHADFIADLRARPETLAVIEYGDTWDYGWKLYAKDIRALDAAVQGVRTRHHDLIIDSDGFLVVRHYIDRLLPEPASRADEVDRNGHPWTLDATDRDLLRALATDARLSATALAAAIGLSADGVAKRIRSLRRRGIIRGTGAVIDVAALGMNWYTFVVRFSHFTTEDEARFAEFTRGHGYIIRAIRLYGRWDALLHIVAPTQRDYLETVRQLKAAFAHNVRSYETWVLSEELAYRTVSASVLRE